MRRSRTLSTVLQFWRSSLEAESEYQLNLVLECLAVSGNLAGSLFVLSLLFTGQSTLGGWGWNEALIVLGLYTILDGFTSCLLQPNLSKIVNHVQQGTLDFVLLKPVDSQLWLSLRCFRPGASPPCWPASFWWGWVSNGVGRASKGRRWSWAPSCC